MLDLFGQVPGLLSLKRASAPTSHPFRSSWQPPFSAVPPTKSTPCPQHGHPGERTRVSELVSERGAFTTFITFYRHSLQEVVRPFFNSLWIERRGVMLTGDYIKLVILTK